MGLLDKVKAGAEQAAAKAKEGVQEVQLRRELGNTYDELGKTAFELVEQGAIQHERLIPLVARVRELTKELEGAETPAGATSEPPASSGPPAMPN